MSDGERAAHRTIQAVCAATGQPVPAHRGDLVRVVLESLARKHRLTLHRLERNATDVLKVLAQAVPIEAARVMTPAEGPEPAIFAEFRRLLGPSIPLQAMGRFEFYEAARERDVALVIATGEQRIYANLLLTIGVVLPCS